VSQSRGEVGSRESLGKAIKASIPRALIAVLSHLELRRHPGSSMQLFGIINNIYSFSLFGRTDTLNVPLNT
jgi:hypothetical protein